jgi:hypothetical protein
MKKKENKKLKINNHPIFVNNNSWVNNDNDDNYML